MTGGAGRRLRWRSFRWLCLPPLLPPLLLAGLADAVAGDWRITPRLLVAGIYTDNIALAGRGSEEHEFITQVTPGVLIEGEGRRLQGGLDYRLENLFFGREPDRNTRFHQLDGRANAIFVPDLLFLDATAGHTQRVISAADAIPLDNLTVSDNRTDVTTYSVAPYFMTRTTGGVETLLRYQYSRAEYDGEGDISDTRTRQVDGHIGRLEGLPSLGWQLSYEYRDHDAVTGFDTVLQRAWLELQYRVAARLRLLAVGGYEDNEYDEPVDATLPRGTFWSAGFAWDPTLRTSLRVTAGERFFGKTAAVALTHRTRHMSWDVSYTEELETDSDLLLQRQTGVPIGDPVSLPEGSELTSEVFLRKYASVGNSITTGRSDLSVRIFSERREYQIRQQSERIHGLAGEWRWRFATRTTAVLSADVHRTRLPGSDGEDELRNATLGVERRISRNSIASAQYRYYERESDDTASDEYVQNMVSVSMQVTF